MMWTLLAIFIVGVILVLFARGQLGSTANTLSTLQKWRTRLGSIASREWWTKQQWATLAIATAIQVFLLSDFFFPDDKSHVTTVLWVALGVYGLCSLLIFGTWKDNGYRKFLAFSLFCTVVGIVFTHADLIRYKTPVEKSVETALKLQFKHELEPILDEAETLKKSAEERRLTEEEIGRLKELREQERKIRNKYELQVPQEFVSTTVKALMETHVKVEDRPTPTPRTVSLDWCNEKMRLAADGEIVECKFSLNPGEETGPLVGFYGDWAFCFNKSSAGYHEVSCTTTRGERFNGVPNESNVCTTDMRLKTRNPRHYNFVLHKNVIDGSQLCNNRPIT